MKSLHKTLSTYQNHRVLFWSLNIDTISDLFLHADLVLIALPYIFHHYQILLLFDSFDNTLNLFQQIQIPPTPQTSFNHFIHLVKILHLYLLLTFKQHTFLEISFLKYSFLLLYHLRTTSRILNIPTFETSYFKLCRLPQYVLPAQLYTNLNLILDLLFSQNASLKTTIRFQLHEKKQNSKDFNVLT